MCDNNKSNKFIFRYSPIIKVIFIGSLIFAISFAEGFKIDLLTTGISSWIYSPKHDDNNVHDYTKSYYNKLSASIYFKINSIKGYLGIPLLWTVENKYTSNNEKIENESKSSVFLSDMSFYFGKKVLFIEPRIGMKIPLGYRIDGAWLGSRNIKLQIGIGLNSKVIEDRIINASGEIMWNLFLGEKYGTGKNGSWVIIPSAKMSYKFSDTFKIGIEILGSVQYVEWTWSDEKEFSAGIVPNIYSEIFLNSIIAINFKAGYGPGFKKGLNDNTIHYTANSTNISIGINIYP